MCQMIRGTYTITPLAGTTRNFQVVSASHIIWGSFWKVGCLPLQPMGGPSRPVALILKKADRFRCDCQHCISLNHSIKISQLSVISIRIINCDGLLRQPLRIFLRIFPVHSLCKMNRKNRIVLSRITSPLCTTGESCSIILSDRC